MKPGDPIAFEVVGPHGWFLRLDPFGVRNIWPCGPTWSWIHMSRSKGVILVRGNAVALIAACDEVRGQRRTRAAASLRKRG